MTLTDEEIFESVINQVRSAITRLSYNLPISLMAILNQCNISLDQHDKIVERLKQDRFNIFIDNNFYYIG